MKIKINKKDKNNKLKKLFDDYKTFAIKSNALSLAIGIIIGTAFTNIVKSFVSSFINPLIAMLTNNVDISSMFFAIDGNHYENIEKANEAGAVIITYGNFIDAILNFLILSIILYILLKYITKLTTVEKEKEILTTKTCKYCRSKIDIQATKCPFCTSDLK